MHKHIAYLLEKEEGDLSLETLNHILNHFKA